ncbi:hypothetical protein [Streptomyces sp. NRRL S-87]|uniref:hypothetical protein n=1 Tax=Streptomyces sp. NRRL S-87 TaxID=1463920 RepID=UPI00068A8718|nr:hypothetical protein [Streptomyces sp. NRRL S-87]
MSDGRRNRSLADYLARAEVTDRTTRYDVSAARNHLLRRQGALRTVARWRTGAGEGAQDPGVPAGQREQWPDPASDRPVDAERAGRDLNAICAVSLDAESGDHLARLVGAGAGEDEGPFVFGCLLHLLGRADGARFWWQLAAGAGHPRAAYCLFLDHAGQGEYHDAGLWAGALAGTGFRAQDAWGDRGDADPRAAPLAPGLLAEVVEHRHEVLGSIPVPGHGLPGSLRAALGGRGGPPRTAPGGTR